ncbi:hypothetical protein, partial [Bacillus sp. SIMBA_033]|uniref:hypothetical protein n=1 Tax=Bacillus sp. SIMBA_033 TaxID=3085776 RepID=UPI00397898D6
EANAVLYRMNANRIGAKLPADAFEGEADDIEAPAYEPVDLDIGLQAKRTPPSDQRGLGSEIGTGDAEWA